MGYDFHITRAESWSENAGHEISSSEWHNLIDLDPELRLAGYNGPHFAIWDGHPEDEEAWLDWSEGNITTKNPDETLLQKMLEVAGTLDANVQGDDGEIYDGVQIDQGPVVSIWSNTSLLALILSLVALAMMAVAFPLESFIRKDHPIGNPMPITLGLPLVVLCLIGVFAWLIGTVFAAAAFFFKQPSLHLAGVALIINLLTGMYLYFTK